MKYFEKKNYKKVLYFVVEYILNLSSKSDNFYFFRKHTNVPPLVPHCVTQSGHGTKQDLRITVLSPLSGKDALLHHGPRLQLLLLKILQ